MGVSYHLLFSAPKTAVAIVQRQPVTSVSARRWSRDHCRNYAELRLFDWRGRWLATARKL